MNKYTFIGVAYVIMICTGIMNKTTKSGVKEF